MDMVLVSLQLTKINIHLHCISIDEKRGKGGQPASVIAHHDNSTVSRSSGLYSPTVRGFLRDNNVKMQMRYLGSLCT